MNTRVSDRVRYRARIKRMIESPPSISGGVSMELEFNAHWAKYTCVLISGYIEQSVREILVEHATLTSSATVSRYVRESWPQSKNMKCAELLKILGQFEPSWSDELERWIESKQLKVDINEVVGWRNNIAHGKESSTNNVTLNAARNKFEAACQLIDFVESLLVPLRSC